MRSNFLFAITCVVALFLHSCSRDYVSIESTNAKGEVPQMGNLVFRFNHSLYPDSLLNEWDSTRYISFSPSIPGRFRWNGPDELVFSPSEPLHPATTYKAELNKDILRFSEYNRIKGDELQFHTSPLSLTNAQVTWVLMEEGSRTAVPQLHLQFNYAVRTEDIREKLKVEVEGNDQPFTIQQVGSSNIVAIQLRNFKAEDRNYDTRLTLQKGLKPEKGMNRTEESIVTTLSIPSPFVLNINEIEAEHDGTQGVVHVYTSQQLTGENISRYIAIDPAIKFTVEQHEQGMTIRSEQFESDNSYNLSIGTGLRGRIGGVLKESYQESIAFGQLESDISFTNKKAVYLSGKGSGNIEVRITNTPKVKLVISRIYENNLLMAQRYGYSPREENSGRDDVYDYEYGYGYGSQSDFIAGDVIYEKEIDSRSLPRSKDGRILNISQFEDRLPGVKGIYHVMIRSTKDYWIRDSRFISLSDIGLIAKEGEGKIFVFANSIKTTQPLEGVTIQVYGSNNQLLGTATTNNDGAAELVTGERRFAGFQPAMIIAKTAADFNYLPFGSSRVNTSRFEVGGKRNNAAGFDAFIYPERDIYRPGETIHFSAILRDRNWKSPGALPIKMKMLMPDGKELKAFRKSLNEQGSTEASIEIGEAAVTGSYVLELYSSNDVLLATRNFMIEEFVPDRIRLNTKVDKTSLRPAESAKMELTATNFFGPPAANRNYEMEIQVKLKHFAPNKYPAYNFSLTNLRSFFDKDVREGKTNAEGRATETFQVPAMYSNSGLLQAVFYSTVFDETGRPVSRNNSIDIFTQDVFHGIQDDGYYYYPLNQPIRFGMVSVNMNGEPVTAEAHVQIIKKEYKTVLTKSGSYFRYESQRQDKILVENTISIGANGFINFIPRSPGSYEIRVYRPGANTYVSREFYSYGSWGSGSSNFEVNNEGHVEIDMDKEKYTSNETAKLVFKAPFDGRMLVTIERDKVLTYRYLNVVKRTASMELKLEGEHVPNIYVAATLVKPHEISDIPLTVAHGFENIAVEEKGRKIPIEITAQKKSRSQTIQRVRVKSLPGSYVTLAAVDNGILQVSDFKTPDPYHHYYQKRALEVNAYDLYPLLFPELRARWSSTGGDAGTDMNKRINPIQARRFRLVSYWSGIRKANSNGIAEFEFNIPQFSGEIRLMALSYKDEKFGSSETTMTVADPVVISSGLPRFFSPGDTVRVPVTISNTTARNTSAKVQVLTRGPIKIIEGTQHEVSLSANSESSIVYQAIAQPSLGIGTIEVKVEAHGENFREATEISIRPPSTLQKIAGSGSLEGGRSVQVRLPQEKFIQGSFDYELVVSRSPVMELGEQLRYLVQYPYGCTEQTISAAFPQLYFADFADLMKLKDKSSANENVMEAIRKIKLRQIYNGAVTMWDGEGEANWWATVYAAHFLLEAKKAGFEVDNSLLETMLGYLIARLRVKETVNYYYNRNRNKKIAPKEVAYSLYVLALAHKPQISSMNYYKVNSDMLALDSRYLLSASYAVAGDRRSFASMLPGAFSGEAAEQETGGSFYSYLRDEAIALNALIDADPGHAQIPVMAKHVAGLLKSERYPNTQERAWSFLALGKIARSSAQSTAKAEIRVKGKKLATIDGNWKGNLASIQSSELEIVASGKGRIYYTWVAEGISTTGEYKEEDQYIKIRRKFYDRYGNGVATPVFNQNDLIVVELTLEKSYNTPVSNIVITDLLPAGFEIENPRTKEIPGMDWITHASEPVSLDIRDDRIHFFVDATTNRQRYYYAVRAVSTGKFRQGPVSADAMYNGEIHSYHGAQVITIKP